MKRMLVVLLVVALLVLGFLLYRSRSGNDFNVEPHARKVIENAKQR